MKKNIVLGFLLWVGGVCWGQFGAKQNIDSLLFFRSCIISDLNNDGKKDLLVGTDHSLIWYRNTGNNDLFTKPQTILNELLQFSILATADLDGDNDEDIIVATSPVYGEVFWLENLNGMGSFGPKNMLMENFANLMGMLVTDVDQDGDFDILAFNPKEVFLIKNLGNSNFSIPDHSNMPFYPGEGFFFAVDIDTDGDEDILELGIANLSGYKDKVWWRENTDGLGSFSNKKIIYEQALEEISIFPADLDGDGDIDIIISSRTTPSDSLANLSWLKNLDGVGNFSNRIEIATSVDFFSSIHANDIDSDGDQDIITSGNPISWLSNNGNGIFGNPIPIVYESDIVRKILSADFDNDGDKSIITICENELLSFWGTINYCENTAVDNKLKVINGQIYLDENGNGILDGEEYGLNHQKTILSPNAFNSWTSGQGNFHYFVYPNDFELACQPKPDWQLTTASSVNFSITDTSGITNHHFGLKPTTVINNANLILSSASTRCSFTVPFWLFYENTGTQRADGLVSLELDPLVNYVSANPAPDSIAGNHYFWFFQNLNPTWADKIYLELQMPDVTFLGEYIHLKSRIVLQDNGTDVFEKSRVFTSQINCAYDPNDKLVEPNIPGEQNYTLFGDTLVYTIRFQNTGTDTAINVRIEDVLSNKLDWPTFRVLAASHDYDVYLNENGKVIFKFDNIYLPDKNVNELASHGFVKYSILPLTGLPENANIINRADIFFDFNPAIKTNIVTNVMVSEYPISATIQHPLCHDSMDGSLSVSVTSPETVFYQWNTGQTEPSLTGLGSSSYSLTVTNTAGQLVADTTLTLIAPDPISLSVSSTPEQNINTDGTATVEATGGIPPFIYSWDTAPVQTAQTATGLAAGTYTVIVTDANGCTSQSEVTVENVVNTTEAAGGWRFQIHPNPSSGSVKIDLELDKPAHWVFQIHDAAGKLIREMEGPKRAGTKAGFEVEHLPNGTCTLSIRVGDKMLTKKLVVAGSND